MTLAAGAYVTPPSMLSAQRPAARVAVGLCSEYDHRVVEVLSAMFDSSADYRG